MFEPDDGLAHFVLHCPVCGFEFTHQRRVEVFEREEDKETGLRVTVTRDEVSQNSDLTGNPSSRRQGLTVDFYCENGCYFTMALSQHKGQTFLEFINLVESDLPDPEDESEDEPDNFP